MHPAGWAHLACNRLVSFVSTFVALSRRSRALGVARQSAVLASSLSSLPASLRSHPNMGPKDLESGGDGSTSEGSRSQEGAGQPKGLRQSLSRAFLSSGLQVTFKASYGAALCMPRLAPARLPLWRWRPQVFAGAARQLSGPPSGQRLPPGLWVLPRRTSPTRWSTHRTRRRRSACCRGWAATCKPERWRPSWGEPWRQRACCSVSVPAASVWAVVDRLQALASGCDGPKAAAAQAPRPGSAGKQLLPGWVPAWLCTC